MDTVVSVLQTIGNELSSFFETITTAVSMVGLSVRFIEFFITFLPTVIASGVFIYLAVYVVRFLLLK